MMTKILVACLLLLIACSLAGCDPVSRHKVVTTIFDGYPSLPPPQQYCAEYAEKRAAEVKEELSGEKADKAAAGASQSQHLPYREKSCNDCHDKSKQNGLVAPRNELCFVCHADFIKGSYVHGPVAIGDCLACHQPHSSGFAALLKTEKSAICFKCHREKRVTSGMHEKVAAQHMVCVDCHDPHFGNVPFFLK